MAQDKNQYWADRERAFMEQKLVYDRHIKEVMASRYEDTLRDIQKDIDAFYGKYAKQGDLSIAEAKKRVSNMDVDAYSKKVDKLIKEKNLSKRAQEELKLYNLSMKVNRLELLKAEMNLELIELADRNGKYIRNSLAKEGLDELRRQSGILGMTIGPVKNRIAEVVNSSFRSAAHWSEILWTNQNALRKELDDLLTKGITRGINPRVLARTMQMRMGNGAYVCERLMITEMCRVQTGVQLLSIREAGYTKYKFLAEATACELCRPLNNEIFDIDEAVPGFNAPPMHCFCHCSICAYWENHKLSSGNGSGGDTPSDEPKLIDSIDFTNKTKVQSLLEGWESKIVDQNFETAIVFCQNGDVYQVDGHGGTVNPTALGSKLKGSIITHNHPRDGTEYTFSRFDVNFVVEYKVKELYGIDELYKYELVNDGAEEIKPELFKKANDTIREQITDLSYNYAEDFYHDVMAEYIAMVKKLTYRRWER